MSRSGYSDDCENPGLWRGAVQRAISGKRGQALLIAIRDALDAMPVKELEGGSFQSPEGAYCTLGVLGANRGIDLAAMADAAEQGDFDVISSAFGSANALVQEIMFENDEGNNWHNYLHGPETPAERWQRMRNWVAERLTSPMLAGKEKG